MYFIYAESVCKTGDVRLVGGSTSSAGILEICNNGRWNTVCRDSVDDREAALICRHIGFLPIGKLQAVVNYNKHSASVISCMVS